MDREFGIAGLHVVACSSRLDGGESGKVRHTRWRVDVVRHTRCGEDVVKDKDICWSLGKRSFDSNWMGTLIRLGIAAFSSTSETVWSDLAEMLKQEADIKLLESAALSSGLSADVSAGLSITTSSRVIVWRLYCEI